MPFICGYMGKITKDPELKQTQTGKQNCKFSLANDEGWGNSKRTDFIPCLAWEKTANTICNHFKKGDSIIVEGRWENRPWQKNEKGYDIPNWQFTVNKIHFVPKSKETFASDDDTFNPAAVGAVNSQEFAPIYSPDANDDGFAMIADDTEDLPF